MNFSFIQQIMGVFATEPHLQITIRELSKRAKLTYNATYRITQQLIKKEILEQNKFGNVCVISIKKNTQSINLLSNASYQKASKEGEVKKEEMTYVKLPNNMRSIILMKNEKMMIADTKTADTILLNNRTYKILTIYEFIAILSKQQMSCKEITILQGGEYLYEKIIEAQ